MGIYMDKVREGIENWANSDASAVSRAIDGFDNLYDLFMNDDSFTKAVMDGAETIDTNWMVYLTENALTQYINALDDLAEQYGGSYQPLVDAYKNNPEQIAEALAARDMDVIDVAYMNYGHGADIGQSYAALYSQNNDETPAHNDATPIGLTPNTFAQP